jgi:membrane associated rhomboid family serine protease
VCGLLAAALVIAFRTEKDRRLRVPRIAATAIIAAISFVPGVSLSGHIGGFIGGLVVAMLR